MTIRKTIKEMSKELDEDCFVKLHSGCVVNMKYIERSSSHEVTLKNGEQLIVSRTRAKSVKKSILDYWRRNV
ncbi:hypothetical protein P261_00318 [Lachnospiraceae bacterium TWA4]|nr:hypothetical protein P261_00318 [Lachnospiraceae bacterium TWA4]